MMASDASDEKAEDEEKAKKFRKDAKIVRDYASATKANAVLRSSGYDHLEGPDFERIHKAISDEYQKKAEEMRVRYVVHGIVQGVGFRNFVRVVAKRYGIVGSVRNVPDGSVEILAIGDANSLARFEKEIQASERYGVQVMRVEKIADSSSEELEYSDFRIEKDKKL